MDEDRTITCQKCSMRMYERQEKHQVRCITTNCPLENAAKAGQEYVSASVEERENMTGIIIGTS
jgi:hypothetical protein